MPFSIGVGRGKVSSKVAGGLAKPLVGGSGVMVIPDSHLVTLLKSTKLRQLKNGFGGVQGDTHLEALGKVLEVTEQYRDLRLIDILQPYIPRETLTRLELTSGLGSVLAFDTKEASFHPERRVTDNSSQSGYCPQK